MMEQQETTQQKKMTTQQKKKQRKLKAGVILMFDGYVLMVHQIASNYWGFPKGRKIRRDLTSFATAFRELNEETGIILDPRSIISMQKIKVLNGDFFVVEVDQMYLPIPDKKEIDNCKWQAMEDLDMYEQNHTDVKQSSILTRAIIKKVKNIYSHTAFKSL